MRAPFWGLLVVGLGVLYVWGRRGRSDRSKAEVAIEEAAVEVSTGVATIVGDVVEGGRQLFSGQAVPRTATGAPRDELGASSVVPRAYGLGSMNIPGD